MRKRLLVGGIGNVFLGDDGFGVAVADRLRYSTFPDGVEVIDFGIRGMDLAYALEDYDAAILIDTVARGGAPGTLYVLEPESTSGGVALEMHAMTPDRVLAWIGDATWPTTLRVLGCEPATFGPEEMGREGLSPAVRAAVEGAVEIVESLVQDLLEGDVLHA